jgi:hypothetical protein
MAVALRARQLVKRANPFVHPKKSSWQRRGNGATIRKYGVEMVSETPPTGVRCWLGRSSKRSTNTFPERSPRTRLGATRRSVKQKVGRRSPKTDEIQRERFVAHLSLTA